MQRRAMLKSLVIGVPAVAGAAAAASTSFLRDKSQLTLEKLDSQLKELRSRFEDSDERNRKLARLALGAAALSLGIDIGALL